MANMTSTATLDVTVNSKGLEDVAQQIEKIETALKKGADIKFKVQSDDLKKMSKDISDISTQLKSLQNIDIKVNSGSTTAINDINKGISDAQKALSELDKGGNVSGIAAVSEALERASQAAATFNMTLSTSSGESSLEKQASNTEKSANKIKDSMDAVNKALAQNTYMNNAQNQKNFLDQYSSVGSGQSKALDQARSYAAEYKQIYDALIDAQKEAMAQGVEFNSDFLKGQGWDSSFVDELANKMTNLGKSFTGIKSSVKADMSDLGFDTALAQVESFDKAIEQMQTSLSRNDYGSQMGDIQKALDQLSNIDTPEFTSMREQLNGFYQDLTDMRSAFDSDTGQLDVNKLLGMENWDESKLANWSTQFGNFYKNVQHSVKEFKSMEGDVNLDKVFGEISSSSKTGINSYTKQINDLQESISKLGDSDIKTSLTQQADQVQESYQKMVTAVTKFENTSKSDANYKINMDAATQSVREFESQLSSCTSATQQFTSSGSSGFASFASSVSSGLNGAIDMLNKMFGYNAIFREMRQVAQDCVSTIIEVDTAMNQLEIVTGATASEMSDFFETAIQQAKDLGQSVTDVLDSIQVYSRLGYDLGESSQLAEYTSILSNVAAVETEEATQGLTSVIKGFDMSVDDAEHVADVLIEVGQNYAVSASEILEAFTQSSAAFGATGTTFEEASAIIAAGNAAVQNANTVGTALKTVSARIRRSTTELDELGESYDDLADGFSKYRDELLSLTGFDIMEEGSLDDFKSLYDIFDGISQSWDTLTETQQSRVSEILGGTRQLQVISSILNNWDDATNAYADAMDSAGVATEAQATYMESLQADFCLIVQKCATSTHLIAGNA